MLSMQQHIALANSRGETGDTENVVIQVRGADNSWSDYSRTTRDKARKFLVDDLHPTELRGDWAELNRWRGVDWITGEEINFNPTSPESVANELDKSGDKFRARWNSRQMLSIIEGAAKGAKQSLLAGDIEEVRLHLADITAKVAEIENMLDGQ